MKTQLLLIIFSSPVFLLAQPKFINLASVDPNDKVLYVGVENFIGLEPTSYFVNKLKFSISHGTLTKVGVNKYLIKVDAENPDTLNFYEDNRLVLSEVYQVKSLSYPAAQFANLKDTLATVKQILANPFLSVYLPGCNYKHQFQILSFRTRFIKSNVETFAAFNATEGNYLPKKQIKTVKSLKANDKIQFYDVICICLDSGKCQLAPLTITIK